MKKLYLFLPAIALAVCLVACKTPKLAAGGAYTGTVTNLVGSNLVITATSDLALYTADSSFELAYKTLDAVFLIERNNRQYLWNLSPSIKHTIDKIRVVANQVVTDYSTARTTYIANPTPAGLTGVEGVLAKIQQLVFAATAAIGTTNAVSPLPINISTN